MQCGSYEVFYPGQVCTRSGPYPRNTVYSSRQEYTLGRTVAGHNAHTSMHTHLFLHEHMKQKVT